jgi:hypothetical protein
MVARKRVWDPCWPTALDSWEACLGQVMVLYVHPQSPSGDFRRPLKSQDIGRASTSLATFWYDFFMLYQGDASALLKNLWPRVNQRSGRSRWSLVNLSVYLATNIMVPLITIYFNSPVIIDWMLYFRTNNDLHMIEPDFLQHLHTCQVQPLNQHPNLLM